MPTSERPFQDAYRKDSGTDNVFRKRKEMVLEKDISEHNREQLILWRTFWIRNIHRFILDAMGIKLYPFQIIWVYLMQISPLFVGICSRTASKSFLVACFSVARSILYPGLQTIIAATTKEQAGRIVSKKIVWLRDNSPLCQAEIKSLTSNINTYEVVFHNGSMITVVATNEGALGNRCNDLIVDEFAEVDKDKLDKIVKPFLFPWQAPYLQNPEFENIVEPIRSYYISSAGYANDWWYKTTMEVAKQMVEGKPAGFFATDYLSSLRHNLKTSQQIEDERRDNAVFDMQYGNIPGKSNENSYYQIGMFKRLIHKAWYPVRRLDYALKKNPLDIPKAEGEIRILGIDLATRSASVNDNSVVCAIRLTPSKHGYKRQMVYMESSHGINHISQANRIKDIWYDFKADYIALDLGNIGIDVFVDLSLPYYNEERGIQMPAFTVMNRPEISQKLKDELIQSKTMGTNALPIIFPCQGGDEFASDVHVAFRSALQKDLWKFLVSDMDGEEFLVKNLTKEYFNVEDDSMRAFLMHPYVQTNLFINEAINLEYTSKNSNVKLEEGSGRKDRYSSVSYANYLVSILDKDILREEDIRSDIDTFMSVTFFG
jgi:hypothetical protein